MTYTAFTTTGGTFEADTWDDLVTKIGDWQGERTDTLRDPVELVSVTDSDGEFEIELSAEIIRSANKDLAVWFENDKASVDYTARSEHSTLWNNDGRA